MKNKTIVIILVLIIFPLLTFFYYFYNLDLERFLGYLMVPGIILSVTLMILLNIPKIQDKLKKTTTENNSLKETMFISEDEPVLFKLGYKIIVRFTGLYIPMFYFFSNTVITDQRIQFSLIPFISFPTMSLFFKKQDVETSFIGPFYIKDYIKGRNFIKIFVSNGETVNIFSWNKNIINQVENVLSENLLKEKSS